MKISTSAFLSFFCLSLNSNNVVVHGEDQCQSLAKDYGNLPAGSNPAADTSGTFKIPSGGGITCNLSCSNNGKVNIYIKFESSGTVSPTQFDVKDEGAGCNKKLEKENEGSQTLVGIQYLIEVKEDVNDLKIQCTCNEDQDGGPCFSGDNYVTVSGRGQTLMHDLQIGDQVLTNNNNQYESIYAFGHHNPNKVSPFLQLHTNNNQDGHPLEVTNQHLVYLQNKVTPVRADTVRIGDVLKSTSTEGDGSNMEVVDIQTVYKKGIYTPLTKDGTIIVNDNIVASQYTDFVQASDENKVVKNYLDLWTHLTITPFRILCSTVTNPLCHSYNEEGVPLGLATIEYLGNMTKEYPMFQMFASTLMALFGLFVFTIEKYFSFFMVTGTLTSAGLYYNLKNKKNKIE